AGGSSAEHASSRIVDRRRASVRMLPPGCDGILQDSTLCRMMELWVGLLSGGGRGHRAEGAPELRLHARLELADALARQAELLADVGQRGLVAVGEEAQVDDGALALVELGPDALDGAAHALVALRRDRALLLARRVVAQAVEHGRLAVGEERRVERGVA